MNLDDASSVTSLNSGLTLSRNVLVSDFFEMDQSWQAEAGYVLLLINLSYCLGFLAKLDCRVDFTEDLPSGKDVTHHIADMRNAACHLTSGERVIEKVGKNTAHFNVMIGRGASSHVNGVTVRSP